MPAFRRGGLLSSVGRKEGVNIRLGKVFFVFFGFLDFGAV